MRLLILTNRHYIDKLLPVMEYASRANSRTELELRVCERVPVTVAVVDEFRQERWGVFKLGDELMNVTQLQHYDAVMYIDSSGEHCLHKKVYHQPPEDYDLVAVWADVLSCAQYHPSIASSDLTSSHYNAFMSLFDSGYVGMAERALLKYLKQCGLTVDKFGQWDYTKLGVKVYDAIHRH